MNVVQLMILTNIFKIFKIQKNVIHIVLNNVQNFKFRMGIMYTS
jgi:hypothetical protein